MRSASGMLTLDEMIYLLEHLPNPKTFYIFYRKNDAFKTIKTIVQHATQLSKLVFEKSNLFTNLDEPPYCSFPIDDVKYISKSVEDRSNGIKLTVQLFLYTFLINAYISASQSVHILNMAPKLLTIEQRIHSKRLDYPI